MKRQTQILLIGIAIAISSCGGLRETFNHSSARKKAGIVQIPQYEGEKGTLTWAHYDASKRGSMIYVDKSGNVRILAENPPDAAIQSITEISAKVGEIKGVGSVDAALKTQRSIAELGKRTAAVNMMRDALYRLNEMYYSSVDRTNKLLQKREEYIDKTEIMQPQNLESVSNVLKDLYPINQEMMVDSNGNFLRELFEKVLDNTKEIAVEEAKAEIKITESTNKEKIERYKDNLSRRNALLKVYEDLKGDLSKQEKQEFLEKILALQE